MSAWAKSPESILYLSDPEVDVRVIAVRLNDGLRTDHLAHDLAALERRARLIIEQYKRGDWDATPMRLPDQYLDD